MPTFAVKLAVGTRDLNVRRSIGGSLFKLATVGLVLTAAFFLRGRVLAARHTPAAPPAPPAVESQDAR